MKRLLSVFISLCILAPSVSCLPEWTKTTFARGEDIYEFDAGKVPNEFRNELLEIRDYLYSVAVDYIKKELKDVELSNGKKQLRIEYDYLKKNAKYQTIDNVVQQARDWHNELSNNAKNAMTLEQKEKADTGTKFVMDLGNGLSVFQLITPEALDYEGNAMGVCIGDGVYDEGVKKGASQIYSVRNSNGSHATIEVRRNVVHQIKGKANGPVNGKYIKQVREFLKNYLNCAFPNEFTAEERARITNKDLVERNTRSLIGQNPTKITTGKTKTTFKDVAGIDSEKQELMEVVDFLKNQAKFKALGARVPRGILLSGEPGTGKTLLARAVAGEANVPFFATSGSDFSGIIVGLGVAKIKEIFELAKRNAPCILFIDEIDAIGQSRSKHSLNDNDREQTLNQLLIAETSEVYAFCKAVNSELISGKSAILTILPSLTFLISVPSSFSL